MISMSSSSNSSSRAACKTGKAPFLMTLLLVLVTGPLVNLSSAAAILTMTNGTSNVAAAMTTTSLSGIEVVKLGYTYTQPTSSSSSSSDPDTAQTDDSSSSSSSGGTYQELSDFMNANARVPTKIVNVTKIIEEKVNLILSGANLTAISEAYIPDLESSPDGRLPLPYLSNKDVFGSPRSLALPLKLYSVNGVLKLSFSVQSYRWANDLFAISTRAYCVDEVCSIPGPTLYVKPGDTISLHLSNRLEEGAVNETNVFFYGLRADPASYPPSASAGSAVQYTIDVPSDHHPGVHWYSSRTVSQAALQIMGGLVGAIVVEPSDDQSTSMPPFFTHTKREVLVLTHVYAARDDMLGYSSSENNSYEELAARAGLELPSLLELTAANNATNSVLDAWFCNGQYQPVLTLPLAEWRVFDIVVAAADRMVELELKDAVGNDAGNDSCDMRLIAIDGVYLAATRAAPLSRHIPIPMGGRVSVAVSCDEEGMYFLQSSSALDKTSLFYQLSDAALKSAQNLLTINATGASTRYTVEPPTNLSAIARPTYLASRLTAVPVSSWSIAANTVAPSSRTTAAALPGLGVGSDCTLPCFANEACELLYGALYSVKSYPSVQAGSCSYYGLHNHTSYIGDVEELSVWGAASTRLVLGVRGAAMQFVSFAHSNTLVNSRDKSSDTYFYSNLTDYYSLAGDFRDTWPALAGRAVFRLSFSDYAGSMAVINHNSVYSDLEANTFFTVAAPSAVASSSSSLNTSNDSATADSSILSTAPTTESSSSSSSIEEEELEDSALLLSALAEFCDVSGSSHFYREELNAARRVRTVTTASCPNHFSACQAEGCGGQHSTHAKISLKTITIPLYPSFATAPQDRTCSSGSVGVALNGVAIKGPSASTRTCVSPADYGYNSSGRTACPLHGSADGILACGDTVHSKGSSFDKCGGYAHVATGEYAYHAAPVCLIQQLQAALSAANVSQTVVVSASGYEATVSYASSAQVSPQLGWALDGFPIYGPYGAGGIEMFRCGHADAHTSVCLDECNGYAGELPSIDAFTYRYHFSGGANSTGHCSESIVNADGGCSRLENKCCVSALPPASSYPYSIGCLRGCEYGDVGCVQTGAKGTSSTYAPAASHFAYINSTYSGGFSYASAAAESSLDTNAGSAASTATAAATAVEQDGVALAKVVVVRVPSNGSIVIASETTAGAYTYDENIVPSGTALLSSSALSADGSSLAYATVDGLHTADLTLTSGSASTVTVAGWVDVAVRGFNFGSKLSDVKYVKVKGTPCTSLRFLSSELLTCVATDSATVAAVTLTGDDVLVSTVGGNTQGAYLYPKLVVQSGSGRPVIASVEINKRLFRPQAITFVSSSTYAGGNDVLYWTNTAYSDGYCIQRSSSDGTQVETVVAGVQKSYGIAALPSTYPLIRDSGATKALYTNFSYLNEYDAIFFSDSSSGTVSLAYIPPLVAGAVYSVAEGGSGTLVVTIFSGLDTPTAVGVDSVGESLFAAVVDGVVISYPLSKVAAIVASALASGSNSSALALTLSADRKSLPAGVKVVVKTQRNSRLTALAITSSCARVYLSGKCIASPWLHQRIFTVDTNRNMLIVSSANGHPTSYIDLTAGFGYEKAIYWPISVSISTSMEPMTAIDVTSKSNDMKRYSSFLQYYTVYITEYLGKIWKLRIPVSSTNGTVSTVAAHRALLLAPELVLDRSNFFLSEKLRAHFRALHSGGQRSNSGKVSFEIIN